MERFLSAAWFARVGIQADGDTEPADLVLQQVVTGTPDGEVRYQVSVRGGRATIQRGSPAEANMTFTSDYKTAAAVASGALSTEAALSEGRIRVAGDLSQLDHISGAAVGLEDLADARAEASFDVTDSALDHRERGGDA